MRYTFLFLLVSVDTFTLERSKSAPHLPNKVTGLLRRASSLSELTLPLIFGAANPVRDSLESILAALQEEELSVLKTFKPTPLGVIKEEQAL